MELVGACDPDPERRASASRGRGFPAYASLDELLARSRPELVIVASPPALHAGQCRLALDHGAHVLCEKPFAASVSEGRNVMVRAAETGRQVVVNHEFGWMPIFRSVIEQVAREGAGGPSVVQVWQMIDADPGTEAGWRGRLRHRTLYEAGGHAVDLALALFGEVPVGVSATLAGEGADTTVLATLRFGRGGLAQLTQSRRHAGDRQYLEVRADTPVASYRASFGGRTRLSAGLERSTAPHLRFEWGRSGIAWKEEGTRRKVLARNPPRPLVAATATLTSSYLDALRRGRPHAFRDGLDTLRVIAAAHLAAELGREVALEGNDAERAAGLALAEERPA